MQVDVGGDVSDFASVDGDLVSKHAGSRDLDGVRPVVVVVAECVREVKDRFLRNTRRVFSNVEVSGLDSA